jgi:hypothetical protein
MGMTSKEYHEGYQQGYKDAKKEYENRLKANIDAMLEELKTGINYEFHDDGGYYADKDEVDAYIQQLKRE